MAKIIYMFAFVALQFSSAAAAELWICRMPEPWSKAPITTTYVLKGKILASTEEPIRAFDVLVDNDLAIIGVAPSAIDPAVTGLLPKSFGLTIGLQTFMINRKTGSAARGGVQLRGPNIKTAHGTCHPNRT